MATGSPVVVGVMAVGEDRELAQALAEELPRALSERVDGRTCWRAEVQETEPAEASASASELLESVRRCLLARGWELGVGLTALPLRARRRPVAAQASASHGVGLVSLPALGVLHRGDRLRDTAVGVVEGLLGEAGDGRTEAARGARLARRSGELASPVEAADAERHGTLRFTGLAVLSNLRLLAGMIRANRPARVMGRLSRSATAALGTGAYAVTSANMWFVAHASGTLRLLGAALLSMALILVALVVAHGLWERARDPAARERIVLFNVVTLSTLAIGVATLYLVLVAVMVVAAVVLIPASALEHQIGHGPSVWDFARIAWLAASVATVGGALGSLIESDTAVRAAVYRPSAGTRVSPRSPRAT